MSLPNPPESTPTSLRSDAVCVSKVGVDLLERTVADLQTHAPSLAVEKFDEVQNVAFNLIGFFLAKNWVGFEPLVIAEMRRRFPDEPLDVTEDAYITARDKWADAYYD